MPRRAYVIGSGGHARVVASLLAVTPTFVVPGPSAGADEITEAELLGRPDALRAGDVYVGIGDNRVRRMLFERFAGVGARMPSLVAPTAFVARDAVIGDGVVICPGAVVGAAARIGANVIVNTLSGVDHDCAVGDHTQITVGVTLAGAVRVPSRRWWESEGGVISG
jgi:UDP-perosamine 4-acetyltransferase